MAEKTPATTTSREDKGGVSPLFNLRNPFDRVFDSMMRGWPMAWRDATRLDAGGFDFAPHVETAETDTAYEVTAELPGVDEKDVKVSLEDGVLCIAGEKKVEREEKKKEYVMSERSYGSFKRCFTVPENVAVDKVAARFEKGVLRITLPKSAAAPKSQREIPIAKA